jgi:hypothetical protein
MGVGIGTALLASSVLGLGASMYSSSQAAGDYDVPDPPESPFVEGETARDTEIEEKRRKLMARNASRENFIATGGQGLLSPPPVERKTLLGR